ncbi:MAG: undecaprenyl-diphosphate phosphatase [Alphaproteobacteria bacterium]|nr:undecaprenyl-diphosphate phosphatase [Alphaproteobacteria bacterium]MBV9692066.1 undecaprenyl-diphosphate phosphatase [Alphaproteobacteria bacterium]
MHDLWNAVLLGIVEGLTEFIPVSSTAHLLVAEKLLGLPGERWDAFTVVIQLGAILAVVAIYWRKFWDVLGGFFRDAGARHFVLSILVAFLPSAAAGVLLKKWIDKMLLDPSYALPVIAASWIAGGILILLLERLAPKPRHRDGDRLPLRTAFLIGVFQILSVIFPGTSRSGATILGGELIGVERSAATVFTFYLAVPTMLGATVFELYKKGSALSAHDTANIAVGFVVSFLVAYVVIRAFLAIVARYGLMPFGWYRIASGLALAALLFAG